jgi:acyl carrier protein
VEILIACNDCDSTSGIACDIGGYQMKDVATATIEIIQGKVRNGQATVQPTDKLTDLGLESLDVIETIIAIEEKFDISIPYNLNDKQTEFETVAEVVHAVQRLVDSKS